VSTDLAVREDSSALALIDAGVFAERVAPLLPDTVPLTRFVSIAKTALRTQPALLEADQRTLFSALIRCAQDGLYPDGREAALNVYRTKRGDDWIASVQYLPMIGGLRKRLAEYGWTLKTRVVFANDEFEYSEEPQQIRHVPVRPGTERGTRVAAYAVATHRDGRRLQILLDADDIAKRAAKAKTDKVWKEWPDAMWEKSAGHAIYDEIPQAERDRIALHLDEYEAADAAELLYGPNGDTFAATPAPPMPETPVHTDAAPSEPSAVGSGVGADEESQQAGDAPSSASPAPGIDDDPEPGPAAGDEIIAAAGATVVPGNGIWAGKTLAEVGADAKGREWFVWALRNKGRFPNAFVGALEFYVEHGLKDAA
jgi:recombination protein RecT